MPSINDDDHDHGQETCVSKQQLIDDLEDLADEWRHRALEQRRQGMERSADILSDCRQDLIALIKLAKLDVNP
jgi:hypothetical protein